MSTLKQIAKLENKLVELQKLKIKVDTSVHKAQETKSRMLPLLKIRQKALKRQVDNYKLLIKQRKDAKD